MTLIDRFQNKAVLIEALLAQVIVQGDREVATALAELGQVVEFAAGEVLIHENAVDRDMYFLLFGKVSVSVKGKYLYPREKNVTVGEMSAVNPLITRSATITAMEPTITLKVSPEILDQVAMVQPRVYRLIAAELAFRVLQRNSLIRPPNARPRVFFISSKESLPVAKAIRHGLRYTDADSLIWSDEDMFPPGSYPLEVLEREVDQADFGVAIAHPDDIIRSRRNQSAAPRDNVIFELGFFMSRLGRQRTFLLVPQMEADLKLPSDFKGLTPIVYPPLTGKPGEVAGQVLTSPIYELEQKIQQLGCREL
ncbi:TIR domain-containing protein [Undibacterium griseum]|uniref:Nucleotide-binding protein n=1 Tax=Undibacterium griseum TaxID=2762295 RepID=A0ABR6YKV0_9BURK|nr:TIR domain-containing protein [Undibacterium griseum]MBC3884525.1 nucleotide-binding protein [Undibacterium griseum]